MPLESGNSGHVLVDVLDRVLDKGIVIDAAVRVSVVGIELLGVDARVVVASIETYLRHADTIAYTGMAAAPRQPLPPPLYAEPLEGGTPSEAEADRALDSPRAEESDAPDAALHASRAIPLESGQPAPAPEPDPESDMDPGDAPDAPRPVEDG